MADSINQHINLAGLMSMSEQELRAVLQSVLTDLTSLKTQLNQLRADINGHVHGGVTAGAANTSAMAATTATAVTLNTTV